MKQILKVNYKIFSELPPTGRDTAVSAIPQETC